MRAWRLVAAAAALSIAAVIALRPERSAREPAPEESGSWVAEPSAAAELADASDAELSAGAELGQAARAPVGVAAPPLQTEDPATASLIVRTVSDEDGTVLRDVPLWHRRWPLVPGSEDESGIAIHTSAEGLATLSLPPGGTRVYTLPQDDRAVVVDLAPGETREVVMRLRARPDIAIHLRIVDAQSNEPLPGAEVETEVYSLEPFIGRLTARADAQGIAVLRARSWADSSAVVSASGYTSLRVDVRGVQAGRENARRIALRRVARLHGRVIDASGAPQGGARVSARAQEAWMAFAGGSGESLEHRQWSSEVAADGRYTLGELPADVDLLVDVRRAEKVLLEEPTPLRLSPGEAREQHWVVDLGGSIHGVVLDAEGAPVAHHALLLWSDIETWSKKPAAEVATDGEGRFLFEGVARGKWLVAPKPSEQEPSSFPCVAEVELTEAKPAVEVVLRLPPRLFVSGRCVDEEGAPVAGVNVTATGAGNFLGAGSVTSAADGTFDAGPLSPGEALVYAWHETLVLDRRELPRIHAGDSGIVLRLVRPALVRGTVIDTSSGAPVGAEISACAEGLFHIGGTGAGGSFDLRNLAPGRCVLVARTLPDLVSSPYALDLCAGEESTVELRVAPAAKLRVQLPDDRHVRAFVLAGGDRIGWLSASEGTTLLIPPGAFTVELHRWTEVLSTTQASAAAGEIVELDLR